MLPKSILPAVVACLLFSALAGAADDAPPAFEPVSLLQEFIRTPTVNPPGNESDLTRPLYERFRAAGMAAELTGATESRQNLIVYLPGADDHAKPYLALAHVDTVAADPADWDLDPFSGEIRDGMIWGRGALDDKGMAAALAAALYRLHRQDKPPRVPLIAVFVADEETGGEWGADWLLGQRPELANVKGVINEGHFVLVDDKGPAKRTYYVSVGEKGVAWLRLRAEGTPGHGSVRWGDNPNEKLLRALAAIVEWEHPLDLQTPLGQYAMHDLRKRRRMARSVKEALERHPIAMQIERDPTLQSSLRNTCNVTVLQAGERPNVIPSSSEAVVDCRLVAGNSPETFLEEVRKRIDDESVHVELIMQSEPNVSPWQTPFFRAIEKTARHFDPDSLTIPVVSSGATDSRFWRLRGVPAYGLVPIPISPELVKGMHGPNERIPVDGLLEATDFLEKLFVELLY
jgi:acetylornithine deacetylase/succinyl-diaminopimelate desuccinylase-like protein